MVGDKVVLATHVRKPVDQSEVSIWYCDQLTNHSSPVALVKVPYLPPGLLAQHHPVLGEHHTGQRVVEGGQRRLAQPELSENAYEAFLKENQEEQRLFSC